MTMTTKTEKPQAGTESVTPIDLEEYAKAKKPVPKHPKYRIRVDRTHFVVEGPGLTGGEILALAGKSPATHMLSQKLHGGQVTPVAADQYVDFTTPGIERFMTLPLDTTEGGIQ